MSDHRTTAAPVADVAVVGMGVMGSNLARNFHGRGLTVAVYDARPERCAALLAARDADGRYLVAADHAALVGAFGGRPARIMMMVTAGEVVDQVLGDLSPHLRPDDIVIDGGNSHFRDTERRAAAAREAGYRLLGVGVSGGERGARFGPSLMAGGDEQAYERLRPILEPAAAVSDAGPCLTWCGRGGAGHFVKMVHNGIEYAVMQLIAETHALLRAGLALAPAEVAAVFDRWNAGELRSYLVEITAAIAAAPDPERPGGPLVDRVLDVAGEHGTGRWTSIAAITLGVPTPTLTAAVDARAVSAAKAVRVRAEAALRPSRAALPGVTVDTLGRALYAAEIVSYTQGFALLREASRVHEYGTDLAAISRVWRAGCVIRAALLDRIHDALQADDDLPLLLLDGDLSAALGARMPALREVVAAASAAGFAIPALAASLAYCDGMTCARGTANLIAAQRDYFGAHAYRRADAPRTPVHTDWEALAAGQGPPSGRRP